MESEGSLTCSQMSFTGPHHEQGGFCLYRLILSVYVHLGNIFSADYFHHVAQNVLGYLMSVRPSSSPLFLRVSP